MKRLPSILKFRNKSYAELCDIIIHARQQGAEIHNLTSKDGKNYSGFVIAPAHVLFAANEIRALNAA